MGTALNPHERLDFNEYGNKASGRNGWLPKFENARAVISQAINVPLVSHTMTTTIRTSTSNEGTSSSSSNSNGQQTNNNGGIMLESKIDGISDRISAAFLLRKDDGVVTVTEDKSVRVWLKRDTGKYWPSICHFLPAVSQCLDYNESSGRLFIGMENGVISEFKLSDDFNSIQKVKDFYSHSAGVTAVKWCIENEWILSVGKDKQVAWQFSETAQRLGTFGLEAWCTCLEFDSAARYAFVGDYSGSISVIKLSDTSATLVTKLSAHTGSVRSISWDAERQQLYSGSNDNLVIGWDIGGKKGTALEMTGHKSRVTSVKFGSNKRILFTASDTGTLVAWDMAVTRKETPAWNSSDNCESCDAPFFWNVRVMWERKVVGLRQHHCRLCGKAVCHSCSGNQSIYPKMGFEIPVRLCNDCYTTINENEQSSSSTILKPLAKFHETKHNIIGMDLDQIKGRLITFGTDRLIKIWDVTSLLH